MDDVVLMSDARVTGIACRRDGPLPLVPVRESRLLTVDCRKIDEAGAWRLLRAPVRDRLVRAARRLPAGYALRFVEGYRPPSLPRRAEAVATPGIRTSAVRRASGEDCWRAS